MPLVGKMSEQQQKVYTAQREVVDGVSFIDYAAAQDFADSITSRSWWREFYPHVVRIEVLRMRAGDPAVGRHESRDNCALVALPPEMLNETVLLHELAHAVFDEDQGHGPIWAREFMTLMYRVAGSDRYLELYDAFTHHGVNVNPD